MATIEDDIAVANAMTLRELQKFATMFKIIYNEIEQYMLDEERDILYRDICNRFAFFAELAKTLYYAAAVEEFEYISIIYAAINRKIKQFVHRHFPGEYNDIDEMHFTTVHINPKLTTSHIYSDIRNTFNCIDDNHHLFVETMYSLSYLNGLKLHVTDFSFSDYNVCHDYHLKSHDLLGKHIDYPHCSYNIILDSLIIFLPDFNESMLDE